MKKMVILVLIVFLAGCQKQTEPYQCEKDADCFIKDVHNCCGYYPRCVNKDYTPDIAAVEKECREKGMVSVCGFADITGCKCANNTCTSRQDGSIV